MTTSPLTITPALWALAVALLNFAAARVALDHGDIPVFGDATTLSALTVTVGPALLVAQFGVLAALTGRPERRRPRLVLSGALAGAAAGLAACAAAGWEPVGGWWLGYLAGFDQVHARWPALAADRVLLGLLRAAYPLAPQLALAWLGVRGASWASDAARRDRGRAGVVVLAGPHHLRGSHPAVRTRGGTAVRGR